MPVKCSKCGADIPDTAAFCPGCGAAKPNQPQAPSYSKPPAPVGGEGAGLEGLVKTVFSKMLIMIGFAIAILLSWIGSLLVVFGVNGSIGSFLTGFGFVGGGFILFGGGFLNKGIDKYVRLGMILIGGYMIISGVTAGSSSIAGLVNTYTGGFSF